MRILLTGRDGQVGSELQRALTKLGDVLATDRGGLDLADVDAVRRVVRAAKPGIIVNAAAYTAVDKAEAEPELAMRVNGSAAGVLAEEAKRLGALLVHYSTDYVFDGEKPSPYLETDAPNPLNVYGRSKLAGEEAIRNIWWRHLILRTSWIYAAHGKNFLLTMLRAAQEGKELRVVDDQFGAPTSNLMVAHATEQVIARTVEHDSLCGLYHMSAAGSTSWHGFACAIFEASATRATLHPIPSSAWPATARRPKNSLLDNTKLATLLGVRLPAWQSGLSAVLQLAQKRAV